MTFDLAKQIADKYVEKLKPMCYRIEIAGSIRREKPEVKDIEIVCIRDPKKLFEWTYFINSLEKVKGEAIGKYTQRKLPEGINLDLFMCKKENWGLIFAIRTGSADYSHNVLACNWVKLGYKSIDGILMKDGAEVHVPEEKDLFKLIGVNYIEPVYRN